MKTPAMRVFFQVVGLIVLFFFKTTIISAATATEEMKSTIDEVLHIVTDASLKGNRKTRREMIRNLIDQRFSYEQMGMRALGMNWKSISKDEQKVFVSLFSKLLENAYATKIESAMEDRVKYKSEKVKGKYALVKTEIVRKSGPIPVDYKLIRIATQWKVYDVVIEGVSLIKNYRSQFSRVIHQESYEILKKRIEKRISEIDSNSKIISDL